MEKRILKRPIEHAGRCRERRLPEVGVVVDGYSPPRDEENHRGLVLQIHGCFWHGCRRCYRINRNEVLTTSDSMNDRFERILAVSKKIKNSNYELVEKWECDFQYEVTQNTELQRFIEGSKNDQKLLDPREAFFGGRTGNTVKIFDCQEQETIKYVDVCSLYPYICKCGKYPIGHPKIYVGREECANIMGLNNDISLVNGLIKCEVLPPRNLYNPVLPVRAHGKLIFPVCRTCCEDMIQEDCPHQDSNERILRGTWVSEEIKETVKYGFVIKYVYEIWQYEKTQYDPRERWYICGVY